MTRRAFLLALALSFVAVPDEGEEETPPRSFHPVTTS
jgi:hypothetical protein